VYIRASALFYYKVINKQERAGLTQNNAKKGVFFGIFRKTFYLVQKTFIYSFSVQKNFHSCYTLTTNMSQQIVLVLIYCVHVKVIMI